MRQILVVPLMLVVLLISACDAASSAPSPLPSPVDSPLPTAIPLPSMTPTPTKTPTSTVAPTRALIPTPTPAPSLTSTPEKIAPPAGLFFQTSRGLWLVDEENKVTQVVANDANNVAYLLAPTHDRVLIWRWGKSQVQIVDLKSNDRLVPKIPPHSYISAPQWWPGRPNTLLLGTWKDGDDTTMSNGFLSEYDITKSAPTVLDGKTFFFGSDVSPDGALVAYDGEDGEWLYRTGIGRQSFKPENYGLVADGRFIMGNPSWSPDGKQLAWIVGGRFAGGDDRVGVAIFDLKKHSVRLLHPYQIAGTDVWPYAAVWSPNGRWLAFGAVADSTEEMGLWVTRDDGTDERHLAGLPKSLAWSPDSHWIIFTEQRKESSARLTEIGTWQSQPIALPPDAEVIGWVDLSK